jgi:hypothetical protein
MMGTNRKIKRKRAGEKRCGVSGMGRTRVMVAAVSSWSVMVLQFA